ncbi:hypothetical protein TKV_c09660 [Thermoanaerobacter kivui]|uniref:Uncharacterized protein n=1 Tax=Thermoanaerobacter kivui TaxID=2325 RepID=A0A097AQR4_THEKI|nr:hypothetical protein TKV_c09660 [Thermoanaerobacter kivui]
MEKAEEMLTCPRWRLPREIRASNGQGFKHCYRGNKKKGKNFKIVGGNL